MTDRPSHDTPRAPSLSVKLAAALLALRDETGEPLIPYEHAKLMTADQVASLFRFDHYPIRWTDGGPTLPWNIVPRLIAADKHKTFKDNGTGRGDLTDIAHDRALRTMEAVHRARMAECAGSRKLASKVIASLEADRPKPKSRIPSRPFSKQHRPLQSRNDLRRRK